VLLGSIREDRGDGTQERDDSRGRMVLAAEAVDQDERHLPPVLVPVRGWVKMQQGAEQTPRAPFKALTGHC
jgi:hypothetical protein